MKNDSITRQTAFRFRRWNRHRYAVFCSIGRYVNIGRLSNRIADASTGKIKKKASQTYFQESHEEETGSEERVDTSPIPELTECLISLSRPALCLEACRKGIRQRKTIPPTPSSGKSLEQATYGTQHLFPAETYRDVICINASPRHSEPLVALRSLQGRRHTIRFATTVGRNSHNYTNHIQKVSFYDY